MDNPERAASFVAEPLGRTDVLANFPKLGRRPPERQLAGSRELVFRAYRIFYSVSPERRLVKVHRFWHSTRDQPRLSRAEK